MGRNHTGRRRLPPRRRRAALVRAGGLCEVCRAPATDVHHRKHLEHGGTHDLDNLVALCEACHLRAHGHQVRAPDARTEAWDALIDKMIRD